MLKEFRVDNFKSLINVVFQPHEQNLLLGINNAGKTNLCQALRFLGVTASVPLSNAVSIAAGTWFGIPNFFFAKETVDFEAKVELPFEGERLRFNYQLSVSIRLSPASGPVFEVESETLLMSGEAFAQIPLLTNTREGVQMLHELDWARGSPRYVETSSPRDATMLQRLYDVKTNPRANHFKHYLESWRYYCLSQQALRGNQHRPDVFVLYTDGGNLASVIYYLKVGQERRYRRLLDHVRRMDPTIDAINFVGPTQEAIFMSFEDARGNVLPAFSASGGTLRYLALLYVLLAEPFFEWSPLIIIEEPENGIYVGLLKDLLGIVSEAQTRPQLVFTTHSPYFIDLFDDRLDSVFVMKRGEQHSSIHQPDPEKVRARLEQYPLGEQHFREMLG